MDEARSSRLGCGELPVTIPASRKQNETTLISRTGQIPSLARMSCGNAALFTMIRSNLARK